MRRGDALFAQGDLAGARLFYEFGLGTGSGGTGSGRAAFALGKTYDPLVHRQLGVRGVPSDPAKAADWYRTAIAAGNAEAERWLQDLTAWLDHGR
jgi:TPR repeat protein